MRKEYDLKSMKVKRRGVLPGLQGEDAKQAKVRITISLDQDIVDYFKKAAETPGALPYQTQINQALRQAMANDEVEIVKEELLKDADFIRKIAEQIGTSNLA